MANKLPLARSGQTKSAFKLKPLTACVRALLTGGVIVSAVSPVQAELPIPAGRHLNTQAWTKNNVTGEVLGNALNINQVEDRVLLNWESFNVGKDNSVNFKQPASTSIAVNRINPTSSAPSEILGAINANGQVLLLNKNGFVFGKDSTVNVHGLVASSLNVDDKVIEQGIGKVASIDGRAAFDGGSDANAAIRIENGAQIKSGEGQRILIIAPSIVNEGSVEAPGGQVMMAAAKDKVYLQEAGDDSDVRGLLVEVKTGGEVKNLGSITANRGNVTLMGFAVKQQGKVSATTSVNVNGTIRLLAREGGAAVLGQNGYELQALPKTLSNGQQVAPTERISDSGDGLGTSATVTLAEGSTTEIKPELEYVLQDKKLESGEVIKELVEATAVDGQKQSVSRVEISGDKILMKAGAEIVAPHGKVELKATKNPSDEIADDTAKNSSRIVIESGAKIDVSGLDVTKDMESNVVSVKLQSNELKDAPLQKKGLLFGKTVLVDIREGSTLFDITPARDGIKRTLAERFGEGGKISLQTEGEVVIHGQARLDFSGGAVTYRGGQIVTTKLLSNGVVYDIRNADPLLNYDGVVAHLENRGEISRTDRKWGVTKTWKLDGPSVPARREEGYVEGRNAGSMLIRSNGALLDGEMLGHAISGRRQRKESDRAKGGTLTVDTGLSSVYGQDIVFGNDGAVIGALHLTPEKLFESGIETAVISTNGAISVAEQAAVKLLDGSKLTLKGGSIDVAGSFQGAGATVNLETHLGILDGHVNVLDTAAVALQGRWVNDLINLSNLINHSSLSINGGTFKVDASGDVALGSGSVIDVSGGAWLQANGKLSAGTAGEISLIAAGLEPGSNLVVDGTLLGHGLEKGGKLGLEANGVEILDQVQVRTGGGIQALQLDDDFFSRGGFADFSIIANINGLTVKSGTSIDLVQSNRVLNTTFLKAGNAEGIAAISNIKTLLPEQRSAGSLTLKSIHTVAVNPESRLVVERNTQINADNSSDVNFVSDSALYFDGSITAHGGDVSLKIIPPTITPDPMYVPDQGIWLGSSASIDVSGYTQAALDRFGHLIGDVVNGGSVLLSAERGFVATTAGSSINVSGTQATLDVPTKFADAVRYAPTTVGSHAGSIAFLAAEGIFIDGEMKAKAGNVPGTAGGSLSVSIDKTKRQEPSDVGNNQSNVFLKTPRILQVSQHKASVFSSGFENMGDALPKDRNGWGFLAAQQVSDAGFSSATLHADNEIRFQGDVSLTVDNSINLDAPRYGWVADDSNVPGTVALSATTVSLGSGFYRTTQDVATDGDGRLFVKADLIELVGGATTFGIDEVNLIAAKDIRFQGLRINSDRDFIGEFKTFSTLNLTAEQIYPTTLTEFTLLVSGDPSGVIRFDGHGDNAPVLSAYGSLTAKAPNIEQRGVLKSPFGKIVLDAEETLNFGADSITSVSAEGAVIPYGITSAGLDWLYPIGYQNLIVKSPQKNISVKANKVLREEGALIDLSGGGDLSAYEFVPGPGGSKDVLDTRNSWAILPTLTGYAPYDPLETPESGLKVGDSVYLGSGSGLVAGEYTLLPAHYALLPGAFLVTAKGGAEQAVAGSASKGVDGADIVAGYRAVKGTGIRDQAWSEFIVEPGSIALTRSEFAISRASTFFKDKAIKADEAVPRLPQDAGQLTLTALTQLDLPTVRAAGNLGGLVDIVSDNINIVNQKSGLPGIELLASDIDKFKVESLLLGGTRTFDTKAKKFLLDVKTNSVTVAEDVKLVAPELIFSAIDKIEVKRGAHVAADGEVVDDTNNPILKTVGDGALLRVSAGKQAKVERTGASSITGDLIVDDGAIVGAGKGSILLDFTHDTVMDGEFELDKEGSLNLTAESIHLGSVSGAADGISIDNALLSKLAIAELVLSSRGSINLYGDISQVRFGKLVLNAAGLSGYNNGGISSQINADSVTLANYAKVSGVAGTGAGTLNINANTLIIDESAYKIDENGQKTAEGGYKISGYDRVNFNLDDRVVGRGEGQLKLLANTSFNTGLLTGESGAKTVIDASGYDLALSGVSSATPSESNGIAARIGLVADAVTVDTRLLFKAGIVSAKALQDDLTLGGRASVDVTGVLIKAGLSQPAAIGAGRIELNSVQKNVVANAGSRLLLSTNVNQNRAGMLSVSAVKGEAILNSHIDARGFSDSLGGAIALDINSLGSFGFNQINSIAANAGFSGGFDLRLRSGDISIAAGQTLKAGTIGIAADSGKISVDGTLDARGLNGGRITLAAEDQLLLNATAELLANSVAVRGDGGKVYLSSLDQHADGAGVEIVNGARIDVSKAGVDTVVYAGDEPVKQIRDGEVHLRADRLDSNGDGVLDVNVKTIPVGAIVGDASPVVEAVKIYNDSSVSTADINSIKSETLNYMNSLAANSVVSNQFQDSFEILPGIEIRSAGDITLANKWDFADWRYGVNKAPGYITLRAANKVVVDNDFTDGFAAGKITAYPKSGNSTQVNVADMLQTSRSWSYKLVAGADSGAANNSEVLSDTGDVTLAAGKKIRTGTGDIEIYAGQDVVYGSEKSAIYTAGRAVAESTDSQARYGFKSTLVATRFYAEYPVDGGDISVSAGRDVKGAPTTQLITDWLVRTGDWSSQATHAGERPTAWGIMISNWGTKTADYRQSLGALGGGDIKVVAGGNVSDLSVVIPTTGKQVGDYAVKIDPSTTATRRATETNYDYLNNKVEINGGGDLDMMVGGDIAGGLFYVDGGIANIAAAGSFHQGRPTKESNITGINPILALGNAQFNVTAGKDIALEGIIDPMVLPQGKNFDLATHTLFFRYSADSSVALTAITGDLTLANNVSAIVGSIDSNKIVGNVSKSRFENSDADALTIYPAILKASALEGNVSILGNMTLYPSAKGTLELFAHESINTGDASDVNVMLSDADLALMPTYIQPTRSTANPFKEVAERLNIFNPASKTHAAVPVHLNDHTSVLISTDTGDISGTGGRFQFALAKPLMVKAGNDILNVSFQMQHNLLDSVSTISANRDIKYEIKRNPDTGTLEPEFNKMQVSGPGQMTVVAGRDVDLGSSDGIVSIGGSDNPALVKIADSGADITLVAGIKDGRIDIMGFADKFMDNAEKQVLSERLTQDMRKFMDDESLSSDQALLEFNKLGQADRSQFENKWLSRIQKAYFEQLQVAAKGLAVATTKQGQDSAEFSMLDVIETLFPGTTLLSGNAEYLRYLADGNGFKGGQTPSSILGSVNFDQTDRPKNGDISLFFSRIHTTDGGDINLMTPSGGVNAGLAVKSDGEKEVDKVGIIAHKAGDINAAVRDNFAVNLTRVTTLADGNILVGSTEGNIDAGRGAQSALSAPAPDVDYDRDSNVTVKPRPVLAGSGIRTIVGDVLLFAPQGIIDAGEAGIGGNNVTLAATAIVGADNIDVGGTGVGVPVAPTGSIAAGLTGVSNIAASVSKSVEAASNVGKDATDTLAKAAAAIGILSVEILGFGD